MRDQRWLYALTLVAIVVAAVAYQRSQRSTGAPARAVAGQARPPAQAPAAQPVSEEQAALLARGEASRTWGLSMSKDPMSGMRLVSLHRASINAVTVWPKRSTRPSINIRCKDSVTELYVDFDASLQPELGKYGRYTITTRIDEAAPVTADYPQDTTGRALFVTPSIQTIKKLVAGAELLVRYTPFNTEPQIARFDLSGFDLAATHVREACGW